MKRHSSEEGEGECSRPAKANRLDLNATPRGFDLNAPVPEEDYGQGSEWSSAEPKASDVSSSSLDVSAGRGELLNHQLETAASLGIDEDLDLLHSIWTAFSQGNFKLMDDLLLGLCEDVAKAPSAPAKYQVLTCFYVSKKVAVAYRLPKAFKALLSFLDPNGPGSALKKQNLLPVFSCKLLFRAFAEKGDWPLEFAQAYLEDAVSARNWVDTESCREFVINVMTAFRDDVQDIADDAQGLFDISKSDFFPNTPASTVVKNRYPQDEVRQKAKLEFLQALNQLIKSPSIKENPRLLFRFFMLGVCYEEVRVQASSMLEFWLNNPVHFRGAKLVLDRLMHHTKGTAAGDYETVANLLSLKLNNQGVAQMKTSANILYTDIVHQMVQKRPEYLSSALKALLIAESNHKTPQNLKGILTVLKAIPDSTSPERELSTAIKELMFEDFGTRLQDAVLRLTKHLSKEVSAFVLSRILLEPWPPLKDQPEAIRMLWFKQAISLACLLLVQSVAPFAVDEKFILAVDNGEQFQIDIYNDNLKDVSARVLKFQIDALAWCTEVLSIYIRDASSFSSSVRKLMFLENIEKYQSQSGDLEHNCFQLVAYSTHASEEILARVILMGISNQFPMAQEDALEIIEKLVWRAAASRKHMIGTLSAESIQLPAAITKLSAFSLPNAARQPSHQVMLKNMYWRCCLVVVALSVYNPSTIGKCAWESFPTIKLLLEHLITECTLSSRFAEDQESDDIEAEESVEAFLQNEVNEAGLSSLKGNVMLQNNSRKPPRDILEELAEIDGVYSLGRTLRACKTPNFIGDMIHSQDFKEAWKWIRKIISKEPEIVGMLPYEWQCKLLYIYESSTLRERSSALIQEFQVNLRKLMSEESISSEHEVAIVIKTYSQKLVSESCAVRSCGRRCFSGIFGHTATSSGDASSSDDCCAPWLEAIEKVKSANAALVPAIEEALINETSIPVISSYLLYLEKHVTLASLAYTCARFLVKRKIMARSLLLSKHSADEDAIDMFLKSFGNVRETSEWQDSHSPLVKLVSPQSGGAVSMNVPSIVLEAMPEILSIASSSEAHRSKDAYTQIMRFLFPGCLNADGDMSMAFIETQGGGSETILSKELATQLVRTKDMRLIRAGLSKLKLVEKVEILKDLGLSAQAKDSILKELEELSESSARELLSSLSTWQRMSLCGCFPVLTRGSPFSRILSEFRRPAIKANELSPAPCIENNFQERAREDVLKSTLEDLETEDRRDESTLKENYLSFRSLLQEAASDVSGKLLDWVRETLSEMIATKSSRWLDIPSLTFPVLVHLHKATVGRGSEDVSKMQMQTMTHMNSEVREQGGANALFAACCKKIKLLEKELGEMLKRKVSSHLNEDGVETLLNCLPLQLERSVRTTLLRKLEGCYGSSQFVSDPLVLYILGNIKDQPLEDFSDDTSRIERAGRHALLAGILSSLDPSFRSISAQESNKADMSLTATLLQHVIENGIQDENLWEQIAERINVPEAKQLARIVLKTVFTFWSKRSSALDERDWARTLTTLTVACSENGDMPAIVEMLVNGCPSRELMDKLIRQLLVFSRSQAASTQEAIGGLISGLYITYPITVGALLKSSVEFSARLSFMPERVTTSKFYSRVRCAITSIFSGSGNSAAYGFCYYVSANHPVYMILHFSTLRLSLLELLEEQKALLANLLVFTVELLDAARPYLADAESSSQLAYQAFSDLESLLQLFFQILQRASDKVLLGKFAIQLADFLARCLTSGGRIAELVYLTREPVQLALQKFAPARKVSFLLDRLKGPSTASSTNLHTHLDRAALETVDKVKNQLVSFRGLPCSSITDGWNMLNSQAQNETSESLYTVLNDLEQASVHFPSILSGTEHIVASLLKADDPEVSEKACVLLERLLKYSSRNSSVVAGAILEKLGSNERVQVENAARHAGKLFHFCEELQESILLQMFRAGKPVAARLVSLLCETIQIYRGLT